MTPTASLVVGAERELLPGAAVVPFSGGFTPGPSGRCGHHKDLSHAAKPRRPSPPVGALVADHVVAMELLGSGAPPHLRPTHRHGVSSLASIP